MDGTTDGRRGLRHIGAAIAALVATIALTDSAQAATYDVHTCRLPDGTVAGTDGWIGGSYGPGATYANTCAGGGALTAAFDAVSERHQGNYAGMSWSAPTDTSIADVTLDRDLAAGPGRDFGTPIANLKADSTVLEACSSFTKCPGSSGVISKSLANASIITALADCVGGGADCPAGDTHYTIRRAQFTLADTSVPELDAPTGSLLSPDTLEATRTLSFAAHDKGGGVYRARLVVDGTAAAPQVVDDNAGRCRAPFTFRVPCALDATGTITLDTRTLADGAHELSLDVRDATDENRAERGPWQIQVDNLPPDVGQPTVTGTARVGDVLTGAAAVDGQSPTVAYQWLRARADGSNPSEIAGATATSYTVTEADRGAKLLLRVTAEDHGGRTERTSSATDGAFADGAVVQAYCAGRPAGATDPCGDLDGDGVVNRDDADADNDGVPATQDPDDHDATKPGKTTTRTEDPAKASSAGPGGAAVNPDDPAAVAVHNPVAGSTTNGHPPDEDAVISVHLGSGQATRLVAGYGARPTITGTITTKGGQPIAGAHVFLVRRLAGTAAWRIVGSTISAGDGGLQLPVGAATRSADLKVVYFPKAGSDLNRASNPLSVVVRQDATLRLSRTSLYNYQRLWFSGKVRGVVGRGVRVQVQVLLPTGWFTFRTLRVGPSGGFSTGYTFQRTTRTTRYRFRVRVLPPNRSAYSVGRSPARSVTVRAVHGRPGADR